MRLGSIDWDSRILLKKSYPLVCAFAVAGSVPALAQTFKIGGAERSVLAVLRHDRHRLGDGGADGDRGLRGKQFGLPIELVTADHQNKPDIGALTARRWIDQEGVRVIIDVPSSAVAFAVQEITREKQVPFLISGSAASGLTGKSCSPTSVHWTYDTYALAAGAARGLVKQRGKKWFFLTQNNAFGEALQADISRFVVQAGGSVVGSVKHPLNNADFSSFLLRHRRGARM